MYQQLDLLRMPVQNERVPEGWLTVKEAAKRLGVGEQRVRDLINNGRLPAEKIGEGRGGNWLVREEDLALVADRKPGRPRKRRGRPPKIG